jgi:subtilisin family serine protease
MHYKSFLLVTLMVASSGVSAQRSNWQNEDPASSGIWGMSVEKAYDELLKDKKPTPVIVAVIDGGTDTRHPDLRNMVWTNRYEIPGNGNDDDTNGYIDDIHGWNFLGDIEFANLELVRVIRKDRPYYDQWNVDTLSKEQLKELEEFRALESIRTNKYKAYDKQFIYYHNLKQCIKKAESKAGGDSITTDLLIDLMEADSMFYDSYNILLSKVHAGTDWKNIRSSADKWFKYYTEKTKYHYNLDYDPRGKLGDDHENYGDKSYGNNDVKGPDASHGTHVAGIIGAERNNEEGINGVAAPVQLMILRAVPNGDEYDKDVANAIRYAVDNGARVINMSFGKDYSPGKQYVDDAVHYADLKDVLIVHGSGNDGRNTDKAPRFPNRHLKDKNEQASNWIEVGASDKNGDAASFSNYGRKSVDVFAPGVKINSTMPDEEYAKLNGTSMASPAVAGVAALIRAYYPHLKDHEVREVIMESVTTRKHTRQPGSKKKVSYKKLCKTGGIVNTYKALQLAEQYK